MRMKLTKFNKTQIALKSTTACDSRWFDAVSRIEREIQALQQYQDPVLRIPPGGSTTAQGQVLEEEFQELVAEFYSERVTPRILELEEEKRRLRASFHNTSTPIFRFPVELLSTIFLFATWGTLDRTSGLQGHLPLESIKLTHYPPGNYNSLMTLLLRKFSGIRRLAVEPYFWHWSQLPLNSTLTHIDLTGRDPNYAHWNRINGLDPLPSNSPSPAAFLNSLKPLQNLRSMRLSYMLPDLPISGHTLIAQPFPLPSLRNLDLTDFPDRIVGLFHFIRISGEADVAAFCDAREGETTDRKSAFTEVVRRMHASIGLDYGAQRRVKTLRLTFHAGAEILCEATSDNPSIIAKVAMDDFQGPLKIADLLDILKIHFTFSTLTSLVVDDIRGLDDHDVWERLGLAPSLQIITLHHSSPVDLVETLDRHPDPPFPDPFCPYFPALSTVEIVGLEEEAEEYEFNIEEFTRRLIRMCKRRIKFGYPLARLRIEESNCFEVEHVTKIKQRVPSLKVTWDRFSYSLV
ncbi:hypothetical protein NMY22_g2696 [Coprinellus aureogranulatus]|nr:hypothetical protein NMY22_g2696 [Coprinellus aureogranulatus]